MEFEKRSKVEFGAYMQKIREEHNVSREELSKTSSMSVNAITKFENGTGDLPITSFIRICVALGIQNVDEVIYKMPE